MADEQQVNAGGAPPPGGEPPAGGTPPSAGAPAPGFDADPDHTDDKCGESPHGASFTGWAGAVVAVAIQALLTASLVYMIIAFFPDKGFKTVNYFGANLTLGRDTLLFIVVLAAGALGGSAHSMRSLFWYFGNANLRRRWMLMYTGLPFVGGLLALFFYLLLRGGLLASQNGAADLNPYGFTAVGAVVGLFSEQAAEMLLKVFSTMFSATPSGADRTPPKTAQPPSATG
jgi:hypothetical protein